MFWHLKNVRNFYKILHLTFHHFPTCKFLNAKLGGKTLASMMLDVHMLKEHRVIDESDSIIQESLPAVSGSPCLVKAILRISPPRSPVAT